MTVEWSEASPSVMATADEIIARYHPSLRQVNIVFMFRDKAGTSGGKLVYGHAAKVSAQMRQLLDDADFIIWVSQEDWEQRESPWRAALIDHLLCHCVNDSGKTSIRPTTSKSSSKLSSATGYGVPACSAPIAPSWRPASSPCQASKWPTAAKSTPSTRPKFSRPSPRLAATHDQIARSPLETFPPGLVLRDEYGVTAIVRSDRSTLARFPEVV